MNSFLKTFTASLLAILVSGVIFFVGSIILIAAISSLSSSSGEVDGSVLHISLGETITDKPVEDGFSVASFLSGDFDQSYITTLDILNAIEKAKSDDDIKGIYLSPSMNMNIGTAQLEEIRSAIAAFKSSGKFVISYSNTYEQGAYYLASVSDKIYLNPEGALWWKGLSSEVMFFKGALDKLGITPQIVRHGTYKSAVEPYTSEKMSSANREQMSALLGSIWDNIVTNIASERSLDAQHLQHAASKLLMPLASDAVALGLVDELLYKDQVLEKLEELTGEDEPKMVSLASYIATGVEMFASSELSENKIALLYAEGDIVDGRGDASSIGGDRLAAQIATVRKDSSVKALVLRVNSPGGSSLASEIIWREVSLTQQVKPVIVSMGNYAASGGYYISAAADMIIASPATITGSIGVFALGMDASRGAREKLGITVESVNTNENSNIMSIFSPITPTQKQFLLRSIEQVYKSFTGHVASGRNLSAEQVEAISQGRVWSGVDAGENGLIDGYGTLQDAITIAADRAGVASDFRVKRYSSEDGFMAGLFSSISSSLSSEGESPFADSELMEQAARLKRLAESSKLQTLMPYSITIK